MALGNLDERYVNFYTDFAFKKLFGTEVNKDLLISFLNSMFDGKEVIRDLTYLNNEQLGTGELDRKAVFDVYCENEKGEKFLVEMQKAEQQFFKDRSVFYSTFPIRDQAIRGNSWDYNLKTVYTIGILNFCFDDTDPEYFHHEVKFGGTRRPVRFFMTNWCMFISKCLSLQRQNPNSLPYSTNGFMPSVIWLPSLNVRRLCRKRFSSVFLR